MPATCRALFSPSVRGRAAEGGRGSLIRSTPLGNYLVVPGSGGLRSAELRTYTIAVPGSSWRRSDSKGRAKMSTRGRSIRWLLFSLLSFVTIFAAVLVRATGDPALVVAARDGDFDAVRTLLAKRV